MRLFDVLGPVMTGPSSSHTAGAVRIGLTARNLLGEAPKTAEILLHGSFAATGRGHGTDRALVAGLLGMLPDDERIPDSFSLAQQAGLDYTIGTVVLRGAHPNTALLRLEGDEPPQAGSNGCFHRRRAHQHLPDRRHYHQLWRRPQHPDRSQSGYPRPCGRSDHRIGAAGHQHCHHAAVPFHRRGAMP